MADSPWEMDAAAVGEGNQGGWQEEDVTSPDIIDKAKFAVDEHNSEHCKNLEFVTVTNAESYTIAGVTYRLTISVQDEDRPSLNHALVFRSNDGSETLKSFTELN